MAATIRDVAKKSGLSLGTVSKYINGHPVKETNRLLIEQAIQELQYKPNNIAKDCAIRRLSQLQYYCPC